MGLQHYYGLRERMAPELAPTPLENSAADPALEALDDTERQARLGNSPGEASLGVEGLHCAACVWVLEQLPQHVEGLDSMRVDFASARVHLRWNPAQVRLSELAGRLATLGYRVHALDAQRERAQRLGARRERWRLAIAGAAAGNVMLFSIALYLADFGSAMDPATRRLFEWSALIAAIPALTFGAWPFYRGAVTGLRLRRLHMDLPISVGLLLGFGASVLAIFAGVGDLYLDSSTTLVFLLLLGRHVQRIGQRESLSEAGIMEMLLPAMATRRAGDGEVERVSAYRVEVGDSLRVVTGEVLAADGVVQEGQGYVDASSLTGESVPVAVEPGCTVHAGTRYSGEGLWLRASAVGEATRVGAIARRIVDASDSRPRLQQLVDRLTGGFSAAVLLLAVLAALLWSQLDPSRALPVTLSLLIVSCPCALGLATPVVLAVARARAARRGLLLHDTAVIEALGQVDTLIVDKTGTLTLGQPSVRWAELPDECRPLVAAAELGDGHPLARALSRWSGHLESEEHFGGLAEREVLAGRGVQCRVGSLRVRVGSPAWLGASVDWAEQIEHCTSRGWTPVTVEVDGQIRGIVGVGDALRPEAARVIEALQRAGLRVVVASGDHPSVVEAVARRLGIEEHHGGMSPQDKADLTAGRASWMIGDGINDGPALRAARVGMAVSGGAEIALEVADVSSVQEGLGPALVLWDGASRARRAVRANIGFALAYNLLFASLAFAGLVTPLVAAIIMPLSSISVVAAALWTRSFDADGRFDPHSERIGAKEQVQFLRPQNTRHESVSAPRAAL
jgi:Cu2+-exporting ATPase